jgi:hypothetical protein
MEAIAWKALAGAAAASVLMQVSLTVTVAAAGLAAVTWALQPRKTIQR